MTKQPAQTSIRTCKICGKPWILRQFESWEQEIPDCQCAYDEYMKQLATYEKSPKKKSAIGIPWKHRKIIEEKRINTEGYSIHKDVKEFVEFWKKGIRRNMVIAGHSYTGKSFDAAWAAWAIGEPIIYLTPKEMLLNLKNQTMSYDQLINIPILVIDDIDKVDLSSELKMLHNIIDPRDKNLRITWATHNHTRDELCSIIGTPVVNRLYQVNYQLNTCRATVIIKTRSMSQNQPELPLGPSQ